MFLATLLYFKSISIFFLFLSLSHWKQLRMRSSHTDQFWREFQMHMRMLVFVRGQAVVWLVVQCFVASGNTNRPLKHTVIRKKSHSLLIASSGWDWHLLLDWYSSWLGPRESYKKELCCVVPFCMRCSRILGLVPTCNWCLTEESSAAHYTRQPFRLLLKPQRLSLLWTPPAMLNWATSCECAVDKLLPFAVLHDILPNKIAKHILC